MTPVTDLKSGIRAFIHCNSVHFCRCKDATITSHFTSHRLVCRWTWSGWKRNLDFYGWSVLVSFLSEADVKERSSQRWSSSIYVVTTPTGRSCMQQEKEGATKQLKWVYCLDWSATSTDEEPLHQKQLWSEQCFQIPPWCPPRTLLWTSKVGPVHQCPSTGGLGCGKLLDPDKR